MKKVITAMGDESLNKRLTLFNDIEIKEKDIFYKEGIIEFLEKDEELDIIIFNSSLCKENLVEFLNELSKYNIEIYLLLSDDKYQDEFEDMQNIKIFIDQEDIIEVFENSNYSIEKTNLIRKNKKIISIIGAYGVGKTIFSSFLGKYLAKNNKVLLINFDIFSDDLKFLFNLKHQVKSYKIEDLIFKASKNLYIFNGLKYIFNETNKIDSYKVKEIFENLKMNFEYIIIDTSSEVKLKFIKTIFPNCDYNIFLLEPNILEIKKAQELLEVYLMDLELNIDKTGILVNKYNINSIDLDIIKNIFKDFKILGKINYNSKVNSYINTYTKNNIKIDDLKEIQKVLKGEKNNE